MIPLDSTPGSETASIECHSEVSSRNLRICLQASSNPTSRRRRLQKLIKIDQLGAPFPALSCQELQLPYRNAYMFVSSKEGCHILTHCIDYNYNYTQIGLHIDIMPFVRISSSCLL
jgi:hypothetical protein